VNINWQKRNVNQLKSLSAEICNYAKDFDILSWRTSKLIAINCRASDYKAEYDIFEIFLILKRPAFIKRAELKFGKVYFPYRKTIITVFLSA